MTRRISAEEKQARKLARFYRKTERDEETGCLLWTGSRNEQGYGRKGVGGLTHTVPAHRWLWEQINGPLAPDLKVRHTCDNPPCVEIAHLVPGTHTDNARDRIERGRDGHRRRTHCPHGHPYDEQNTHVDRHGFRHCRTCGRERQRKGGIADAAQGHHRRQAGR